MIEHIHRVLKEPLPGETAHMKFAPLGRNVRIKALKENPAPKLSAVCLLLYQKEGDYYFVLTKRHTYNGAHSGQISFPGGKKEESDSDLRFTALRETEEEIGVNSTMVSVLGELSQIYIPPSGFLVQPYVGYVAHPIQFIPNDYEVNKILEVPLSYLLDSTRQTSSIIDMRGHGIEVPCFNFDNEIVWGATAMILSEFKEVLKVFYK